MKLNTICLVFLSAISSCKMQDAILRQFLTQTVNETNVVSIIQINVKDTTIYRVLDEAIVKTEQCAYFDKRIKNLYAFTLTLKIVSENSTLDVRCHLSVKQALGLEMKEINDFTGSDSPIMGGFYYKNYLFTLPIEYSGMEQISAFPFAELTTCKLRVNATDILDQSTYHSYIRVDVKNNYNVLADEICGSSVLIK